MLSFFEKSKLILFWDEPTISMNYKEHSLHRNIVNIWGFNQIENIILSSATLPNESDLGIMIEKFKSKYCARSLLNSLLIDRLLIILAH
jgi:hypothetical protein